MNNKYQDPFVTLYCGDNREVMRSLPDDSVDMVMTSPPYFGLRRYSAAGIDWNDGTNCQLGSEPTPELYIKHLCDIFDEVKRVLKKTGTIYVNLDDSHAGSGNGTSDNVYQTKPASTNIPAKSLIGIPERFVLEMGNPNWILREDLTQDERNYVLMELVKRGILR